MRRFIDTLSSAERKQFPMATGLVDYAPDALAAISHISYLGNEKHNSGQPLHHAREKSGDHPDCVLRHMSTRFDVDPAYKDDVLAPVFHKCEAAWRAIIDLQETMERVYGLPPAPGARYPGEPADAVERAAYRRAAIAERPEPPPAAEPPRCAGCGNIIDPDVCGCGDSIDGRMVHDGHTAVPMGCDCFREPPAEPGMLRIRVKHRDLPEPFDAAD